MPNRIIREGIKTGERIKTMAWDARMCFIHLVVSVDDFGRIEINSALRAILYPVDLDKVRDADLERWIAACEKSGLVRVYEAAGRRYLEIVDFRQRTRGASRCPAPPWACQPNDGHPSDNGPSCDGHPRAYAEAYSEAEANAIKTLPHNACAHEKPPSLRDVETAMAESGGPPEEAKAFFDYYAARGWVINGQTPIHDWRRLVGSWVAKWRARAEELRQRGGGGSKRFDKSQPAPKYESNAKQV